MMLMMLRIIIEDNLYKFVLIILMIIYIIFKKHIKENIYSHIKISYYNSKINKNDYGNVICSYFYSYALSISKKKDFINNLNKNINENDLIKSFPNNISFNQELYNKFIENNITICNLIDMNPWELWYCNKNWVYNLLKILKFTIHKIIHEALEKNNLNKNVKFPIIHFRCSDVPFIKHSKYYLQKYSFFKKALKKYNFHNDKTVIIMSYIYHKSNDDKNIASMKYLHNLKNYISNLGYNCIIQSKTPIEDFYDLFNSPYVISTGGSFSFMSGFFGHGKFISTEHRDEDDDHITLDNNIFLKNYNIPHKLIKSYYDVSDVENNYRK